MEQNDEAQKTHEKSKNDSMRQRWKSIKQFRSGVRWKLLTGVMIYLLVIIVCLGGIVMMTLAVMGKWGDIKENVPAIVLLCALISFLLAAIVFLICKFMNFNRRYQVVLCRMSSLVTRMKLMDDNTETSTLNQEIKMITRIMESHGEND